MAHFPLQNELIDAVIQFASIEISDVQDALDCFSKQWRPTDKPTLQTCRRVQSDVRRWLDELDTNRAVDAFMPKGGIELTGRLGARSFNDDDGNHFEITWHWFIEGVPLRAVCGLAVATIRDAGLQNLVGLCDRDGCGNYYVDRMNRSKRYCGTDDCNKARVNKRVNKSRGSS